MAFAIFTTTLVLALIGFAAGLGNWIGQENTQSFFYRYLRLPYLSRVKTGGWVLVCLILLTTSINGVCTWLQQSKVDTQITAISRTSSNIEDLSSQNKDALDNLGSATKEIKKVSDSNTKAVGKSIEQLTDLADVADDHNQKFTETIQHLLKLRKGYLEFRLSEEKKSGQQAKLAVAMARLDGVETDCSAFAEVMTFSARTVAKHIDHDRGKISLKKLIRTFKQGAPKKTTFLLHAGNVIFDLAGDKAPDIVNLDERLTGLLEEVNSEPVDIEIWQYVVAEFEFTILEWRSDVMNYASQARQQLLQFGAERYLPRDSKGSEEKDE